MPSSDLADGEADPTTWAEANLPPEQAAGLIALADGLCQIGRLRDGNDAGQFSIFNFLLRAAYEKPASSEEPASGSSDRPLVILMQAGVFRRHAWHARLYWPTDDRPLRIELPSPIDTGWFWWPDIEEIAQRLAGEDVWRQTVGQPWQARAAEIGADLQTAQLFKIRR